MPSLLLRQLAVACAICTVFLLGCAKNGNTSVVVFAAVSTTGPLSAIAADFEKATSSHVQLSFGASSDLARAIAAGAHADVFLSADVAKMDDLERKSLLALGSRRDLFGNALVVIAPKGSSFVVHSAADLCSAAKIATADPESVPLGIYARGWLTKLGVWERVRPHVVPTLDARAAVAAVESGAVDAGIVYSTDAMLSRSTTVLFRVPRADAPSIVYPIAILSGSKSKQARAFVDAIEGAGGLDTFRRFGFDVP